MNKNVIVAQLGEKLNKDIRDAFNSYTAIEKICSYFGLNYKDDSSNPSQCHAINFKLLKDFLLSKATEDQLDWLYRNYIYSDPFNNATSNLVFVGMVMNKDKLSDCNEIQCAISKAIAKTNNHEYSCNKSNHIGDMTEEIFDNIRRCKFAIFEFTTQNAGAYYEAGYAKALGKQCIFLCKKSDFKNIHFDINHLRIILWEDGDYEDLYNNLVKTIKDNNLYEEVGDSNE